MTPFTILLVIFMTVDGKPARMETLGPFVDYNACEMAGEGISGRLVTRLTKGVKHDYLCVDTADITVWPR